MTHSKKDDYDYFYAKQEAFEEEKEDEEEDYIFFEEMPKHKQEEINREWIMLYGHPYVVTEEEHQDMLKAQKRRKQKRDSEITKTLKDIVETQILKAVNRPVETPDYYNEMQTQPIDVMRNLMTDEQFTGFLWGNIIKYAMRLGTKESKEKTAQKLVVYSKWLLEHTKTQTKGTEKDNYGNEKGFYTKEQ